MPFAGTSRLDSVIWINPVIPTYQYFLFSTVWNYIPISLIFSGLLASLPLQMASELYNFRLLNSDDSFDDSFDECVYPWHYPEGSNEQKCCWENAVILEPIEGANL